MTNFESLQTQTRIYNTPGCRNAAVDDSDYCDSHIRETTHAHPIDPLQAARNAMESAIDLSAKAALDGNGYLRSLAERDADYAIMLAQVAQAESLARIAYLLEVIADHGVGSKAR